jgi:preprotein translocase subunit SecG
VARRADACYGRAEFAPHEQTERRALGGVSRHTHFRETMQNVLIVIHLIIVVALVGVVLLQRSEGGGLGMGSGGGGGGVGGFMTGRGQANALTRATAILAGAFFLTSIVLAVIANQGRTQRSIIDGAPGAAAPTAPTGPSAPNAGGVLDQLRQMQGPGPQPPAAPAAPGAPTAPAAPQQ